MPFPHCSLMACQFWRHSFLGVRPFHWHRCWCGVTSLSTGVSSDWHQHNGDQDASVRQCTKQVFVRLFEVPPPDRWSEQVRVSIGTRVLTFTSPPFALTIVSSLYINTHYSSLQNVISPCKYGKLAAQRMCVCVYVYVHWKCFLIWVCWE